tara:strand:- start:130 stop:378 length:249 start_codon:yes stop_codon:yes gene_type:complete
MKFHDPSDDVFLSVVVSLETASAKLLADLACDMDSSLDELISGILEEAASSMKQKPIQLPETRIPEKCSLDDLLRVVKKRKA